MPFIEQNFSIGLAPVDNNQKGLLLLRFKKMHCHHCEKNPKMWKSVTRFDIKKIFEIIKEKICFLKVYFNNFMHKLLIKVSKKKE